MDVVIALCKICKIFSVCRSVLGKSLVNDLGSVVFNGYILEIRGKDLSFEVELYCDSNRICRQFLHDCFVSFLLCHAADVNSIDYCSGIELICCKLCICSIGIHGLNRAVCHDYFDLGFKNILDGICTGILEVKNSEDNACNDKNA